ncbi:MAG: Ig-like domain-containing protein [Thermoanaerobaculia bacterium]
MMKKAVSVVFALLLAPVLTAQPSVRELVPPAAPIGARVLVTGRGLADPNLAVSFNAVPANILQRNDRFIEVSVPASSTGNVRVTLGATLVRELPFIIATNPRYTVSTLAGGKQTQNEVFKHPNGAAVILPDGTVAVADEQHDQIKLVTPAGAVSVLASGFKTPHNLAFDAARRVLYVSDTGNHTIRRVALDGTVTTLAGSGKAGFADGAGSAAEFNSPEGITVASDGAIYIADRRNDRIRKLLVDGTVTTIAGTFREPRGIVAHGATLYVADTKNNAIKKISGGAITTVLAFPLSGNDDDPEDGIDGNPKVLNRPSGIGIDEAGNLIVSDSENDFIRRIDLSITPPAMSTIAGTGKNGEVDGDGAVAQFKDPIGLAVAGAIYVADEDNDAIRRLCPEVRVTGVFSPTGAVTAGAEMRVFGTGFVPGGTSVRFDSISATEVTWISASELSVKLPQAIAGRSVTITVSACGGTTSPVTFVIDDTPIDTTAPVLTITSHTAAQLLAVREVTLAGTSDDAVSVKVNGANAIVDAAAKTFTITLTLLEGDNALAVVGVDAAGNQSTLPFRLVLDTRAPQLTLQAVPACTNAQSLELRGTVIDPRVQSVVVRMDVATFNATVTGYAWTANVALGAEGRKTIVVEARDSVGHIATEQAAIAIDRTAPTIEISESAEIFGRAIALFARANEGNVTATLDGVSWNSGSEIAAEGSHTLRVTAKDCAGNEATRTYTFAIDLTPPRFLTFTPASGAKVSEIPVSLSGTVDSDAREVRLNERTVPVTNGAFMIPNVFADGVNELALEVIDRAGHAGRATYTLGIKTEKPLVEIVEGGEAMIEGAVYTRAVAPRIRLFEQNVTATATFDGVPFTSGSSVSQDGAHTITAIATDSAYRQSTNLTRHFTIDRSGPQVTIAAPANGSIIDGDRVDVRVIAADAVSVSVNGIAATKQTNEWIVNVPLDIGENAIVAVGRDAPGNNGSAAIDITRGSGGPALVLTFPPDHYVTNRPKIDVIGRALRPGSTVEVTVPPAAAASVATDPSGAFRLSGATLAEGEWTITATATENGHPTSVQARVTADFTPPRIRILASGAALEEGATFATQAVISGEALDGNASIDYTLLMDGEAVTSPVTITATGGHTVILSARDAAGNESRLERTFYIGSSATSGCRLEAFDPLDQSIVTSQKVELIGRSGGAAGVKVNGIAAKISNGSFCASVELPQEGANSVSIVCTAADGTPIGDPVAITLNRVTNEPSVTITSPLEDAVTTDETITVTGTLGNGALSVDLNGKPATVSGTAWSVSDVRLSDGLNVLVARARNGGGRLAIASRRITLMQDAPAIAISSPVPGFISGGSTIDVSGTFANVDPASLAVQGFAGAVQATSWSDTTGKFIARDVPLQTGENTIAITGRDRTGRIARAEVSVRVAANVPAIRITSPQDNDFFGASAGATFRVSGTFNAAEGSSIDVNGVTATIDAAAKTFFADVPFSTLPGGMTPVVARLAQPSGGDGAFDSIRTFKLTDAPRIIETFPAPDALEVDPGALVLVLFSSPMERASTPAAFRLENSSGAAVNGKIILDKDVLTFAPATTLTPGERYTIGIAASAHDLASQPLAASVSNSFVVATSAPANAPALTTASGRICAQLIDVSGTTTVPGARVRLDYGPIFFTTTASATGAFRYKVPLSGQAGYHVIRVRTIGADGTLSAAAELKLNLDCTGPRVLRASYDRNVNELTIVFSTDVKAASLMMGSSIQLALSDGRLIGGTINVSGASAVIVPAENLAQSTFTLRVSRDVEDQQGRKLDLVHTQLFSVTSDDEVPPGFGFISGEVYDATTGRPLAGANITIEAPSPIAMVSNARGRYAQAVTEGAHTIRASADGYTTVWRQIVVPAGAGVTPIDIRLTRRTGTQTAIGAQSLAGLLPLGWSPLASIESTAAPTTLTFDFPPIPPGQVLTAVRYDETRDEWLVLAPVVTILNGKASLDANTPGAYALVYGDRAPALAPPSPTANAPLQGVADPCADGTCPPMIAKSFTLDPEIVLPNGSTIATLKIDGASPHLFPSGTAVQAYIDEELHLADGGRELDPPFATDLLLYRTLAGDEGEATFELAPSARAAEVFLEVGFDHIRILPYPGRLDRGTLIGPEGGRVPADEKIAIEIPAGATIDALRASATSIDDPQSLAPIAGYTILAGFDLTLDRATQPTPSEDQTIAPVELTAPARATFQILNSQFPILNSVLLVELLSEGPHLAAQITPLDTDRWTTQPIDRNVLPLDGIIREGRYLLLTANVPIAFARGTVRTTTGATISTPGLGVIDRARTSGIFNIPVPATPAPPFRLIPRTSIIGDGAPYTHASSPSPDAVVNVGELPIVAQPPQVSATLPSNHATNVAPTTTVEATITPGIDPSSITATSITVIDTTNNTVVAGTAAANGILGIRWTLPPGETLQQGRRYVAAIAADVRGSNGALLGQAYTFSFTTAATVTNDEVHPERIRITIPDANGISKIIGSAGALKAGWLAVPVRRGKDLATPSSAVAASDGAFSVTIGGVTIDDAIDLRVLNNNGALTAIIPLTPFAAEDGKAFIAPANAAVSFTSADGITIDVPAGAFDSATRIDVVPASPAAFNGIPALATELVFAGTADVRFEGRAKLPLQLTLPIAAGTNVTREHFLAIIGQSTLGPRLMAIDTLTVIDGKLTTTVPSPLRGEGQGEGLRSQSVTPTTAKDILPKFIEAGTFAAASLHPDQGTLAWSFVNTGASVSEFHWSTLASMFIDQKYTAEAKGAVAFPVPANAKFVLTAFDPATSLLQFQETYNGIPIGAPGTGTVIASPAFDFNGPYPIFATPFRIETANAPPPGVTVTAIRDLTLALNETGMLTLARTSLAADTKVAVLDVETGERRGPQFLPIQMSGVKAGHRLIVTVDEKDIDPSSTVSVVFNEPIAADEASLRNLIRFERVDATGAAAVDLLGSALLRLDSSGRRVSILLPSQLEAGARFRLTLDSDITDRSGNKLKLAQPGEKDAATGAITPIGPAPAPIELWFETRGPHGTFAEFDIRQTDNAQFGVVREIAQYDNLLFVAAVDGGVLAYDVSDPHALDTTAKPIAVAPGRDNVATTPVTDYWSVYVDHHGRVFSTGMSNLFGALRTWRVEDFIAASKSTVDGCLPTMKNTVCHQTGGAVTSQNPGTAYGVGLASAFIADDRVEAIPRKAQFLVGDAEPVPYPWSTFASAFCNGAPTDAGNGIHQKCNVAIPPSGSSYRIQRITVENVSLGLRWSEDAIDNEPARMMNVIAAPGDEMRVTHNLTTYAVISLFGWGLGVFDVNAIESNEVPGTSPAGIVRAKEQVALRANAESDSTTSLAFSPESHILGINSKSAKVYALDTRKGVTEFVVTPPETMSYTGKLELDAHPRFNALRTALVNAGVPEPVARFNTGALYRNPDTNKDYLLITALDYGLMVVEAGAMPVTADSFADVIAIREGATAVRVIDRTNMAAVVDRSGHVLLVDLSRVDERERVTSPGELFPTVARALTPPLTQDPRILWRSEEPIAIGNIAPIIDADTGMLIGADMLGRRVRLASVIDPKLRVTANVGNAIAEIGSIVPIGIEPPPGVLKCNVATDANCRASLGVFRIEARLPGSMTESLPGNKLSIALESERIAGADMPQTPEPYPVAHLRAKKRDNTADARATNDFTLKRVLDLDIPELRYQKGWNRFASDWIVAIADPRAAKAYGTPPTDCAACKRPAYLASQPNVRELYTTGRFLAVRPEFSAGDAYGFLATEHRFRKRIATTPADTIRPASVLVAAQAPPVAGGMLQETTYLHSGEVETSATDYDAGGRAGWNVVIDRTYHSRTIGLTPLAQGWDSSLFRRLRALPNGDVEYRDGAEIWTFKPEGNEYKSPAGLSLKLVKRDSGWNIVDQKIRIASFDDLGRIVSESDEFFQPSDPTSGNVIHYAYDDQGRLASVIDPADRATTLTYDSSSGLLTKVSDWHAAPREIEYAQDAYGRLTTVRLPLVANTSDARPAIRYGYTDPITLERNANLNTIVDPGESIARVAFEYEATDRVHSQRWGTGESATFSYPSATSTRVTDVLGQERIYTLTENNAADRAHITELRETVPVWDGAPSGQLPANVIAGTPAVSNRERVWTFTYADGMQTGSELAGVRKTTVEYTSAPGVAGKLVSLTKTGLPTGLSSGNIASQSTSWMPADSAIVRNYEYQSGPNAAAFLKAVTAGSKRVESPEPHRHNVAAVEAANDSIHAIATYEKNGLFKESASSGGTDVAGAGSKSKVEYFTGSAPPHARFLPHYIREGEAGSELITELSYPSESQTVSIDPRGVTTTTDLDAWQRPTRVRVTRLDDALALETRYAYDAAGRIAQVSETQNGTDVTTTYEYDVMGRRTLSSTNNMATVGFVTTRVAYDLANHRTITTQPGGAISTVDIDSLGRTIATRLETGGTPIQQKFAYDLAGNRVFTTDLRIASATAYDSHGRAIATRAPDGTITTLKLDETGQPTEVKALDPSASETVAQSSYTYSASGRLEAMKAKIDATVERSTTQVWDGGGRTTGIATGNRADHSTFDLAGRPLTYMAGAGDAKTLVEIFSKSEVTSHDGDLPATTESSEKGGAPVKSEARRDTAGGVTEAKTGSLKWTQKYDELGNVTEARVPGRPLPTKWEVDARGNVKTETLPDGAINRYAYDGTGAQTNYSDPSVPQPEQTSTVTDLIGRPITRSYPDGTTETIVWDGARLASVTDRQGRTQSYSYNAKGQLEEVRSGVTVLDRITYDSAGRMTSWKTPDSELVWSDFDLEGRPKRTMQRRFRDGVLLDEFEQQHAYNEHGERTFASMPSYPGFTFGAGWTKGIAEQHDAMGNVTSIARASAPGEVGATVMSAMYRNAGRPDSRTVYTAGGASFVRNYAYDSATSQLTSLSVANANGVFAGSEVTYDGLQLSSARLLGLASGERYQHWSYDTRSRVVASLYGVRNAVADPTAAVPGRAKENLTPADFRIAQERTPALDAVTRDRLAQKQIDTTRIDPPTASFSEQAGHKIAAMTAGPQVRPFAYQGAERIDDGRFIYEFDVKGRLIRSTEKATVGPIRSIAYTYSGTGRLLGRRAEYSSTVSAPVWQLENRPQILAADGLPADTTFVWDPITDRLVSIFQTGGGLLKQIIHGDASYDDPLETATIDPTTGAVTHLYPIYDEAGAGSLQAIVDTTGHVIARNLAKDPYGAEDVALEGAAVDNVQIQVRKTSSGSLDTITISVHATEELSAPTVASGARLATRDNTGAILRTSTVTPTRVDPFTLQWTLTAAEWTALTTPSAATLSIAITNTLRATNWSPNLPFLPPPTWAEATNPLYTSATTPFEIREPLATLTPFITTIPPNTTATSTLYTITGLPLLGTPTTSPSEDIVSARMHAHPFTEPATGLNYVRNRWFDPTSGTWLSPDPLGYKDSSNLYSFAGGDPVNERDPTGLDDCLGFGNKSCADYAKGLPDQIADAVGLNDLPSTGSAKIDKKIRQVAQAPLRLAMVPATTVLSTGESTGEVAYRMERSTFHGEQAFGGTVDDALLVAGAMGDVATVVAPVAMLSGGPELIGSRASQRGSVIINGRKKRQAEELVTWVDEGGNLRAGSTPGMRPDAYSHQSSAPGARSNVITGRGQAPYLEFTDAAGNTVGAKFDGVQGSKLIDRKLNPVFSAKAVDQATRQVSVARHYGLQVVWELPTPQALEAANRFLKTNNISGITVRIAP